MWDTHNASHDSISVNMHLGGLYAVNTRAFLKYKTQGFLPTRNVQIDWQERLSCYLADPAHRRHKYYIEVYLPLLLGKLFEVRTVPALCLFPQCLTQLLVFSEAKVGSNDATIYLSI